MARRGEGGQRVRVGPGEMTCLVCGEVTSVGFCPRCNDDDERYNHMRRVSADRVWNLVPTVSYLREGEFVVVR